MLKPRTRLISLRITEDEYDSIRDASAQGGARCVSEYARKALLGSTQPVLAEPVHECGITACFDSRLTRVEKELAQIAQALHNHPNEAADQTKEKPDHPAQKAI